MKLQNVKNICKCYNNIQQIYIIQYFIFITFQISVENIISVFDALGKETTKLQSYLNTLTNQQKDENENIKLENKIDSQKLVDVQTSKDKLQQLKEQQQQLIDELNLKKMQKRIYTEQQVNQISLSQQSDNIETIPPQQIQQQQNNTQSTIQQNQFLQQNQLSSQLEDEQFLIQPTLVAMMIPNQAMIVNMIGLQMSHKLMSSMIASKLKSLLRNGQTYLMKLVQVKTLRTGYLQFHSLYRIVNGTNQISLLYGRGQQQIDINAIDKFVVAQYRIQQNISLEIMDQETILCSSRPQRIIENIVGFIYDDQEQQ